MLIEWGLIVDKFLSTDLNIVQGDFKRYRLIAVALCKLPF
jgi:hypothetical protein